MADAQFEQLPKPGLTKEQKIGFTLLLIFAILAVSLGILQLRNTLYAPFALNRSVPASIKDEVNGVDALRYRDTDNDGLTDFDELYVYHTSPYLYDTFGYGMSDKEVVAKNLPLCPGAGKNCIDQVAVTSSTTGNNTIINNSLSQDPLLQNPPQDITAMLKDPSSLRQLLISSGMDPAVLNKVSDADLMLLASQIAASTSTLSGKAVSTSTTRSR